MCNAQSSAEQNGVHSVKAVDERKNKLSAAIR